MKKKKKKLPMAQETLSMISWAFLFPGPTTHRLITTESSVIPGLFHTTQPMTAA